MTIDNCKINSKDEIYKIEKPILISERNLIDEQTKKLNYRRRKTAVMCKTCLDDKTKKCRDCGCCVCSGKQNPREIILCDECDKAYHINCLIPPLEAVPEDDWYCPNCKHDDKQIVKVII